MLSPIMTHGRRVFHVFAMHGDYILHDVRTSQSVFVDQLVFDLLELIEAGYLLDEARVVVSETYGESEIVQAINELAWLRDELGFFSLETVEAPFACEAFVESMQAHHPRSMMLLVSRACNLRCTYCYEVSHDWHRSGEQMTVADVRRAVDDFVGRAGPRRELTITFFGGEALLNFEVVRDAVEHALLTCREGGKSVSFTLTTNGTLFTDEIIEFLVDHEFGVMVSLDGPANVHDRHRVDRGGRGTHERVVAGVERLLAKQREAGVRPLKLRATLTNENVDANEITRYFDSFIDARQSLGAAAEAASASSAADINAETTRALVEKADAHVGRLPGALVAGEKLSRTSPYPEKLKALQAATQRGAAPRRASPKICGLGRNMRAVTPNGDAFPCHRFVGMEAYKLRAGFEGDSDLETKRMGQLYREIFELFEERCTPCWARFRCGGTCTWYAAGEDGKLVRPDEGKCDGIRRTWERGIWLYMRLGRDAPGILEQIVGGSVATLEREQGGAGSGRVGEWKEGSHVGSR